MLELTIEQISMGQSAVDKSAALQLLARHLVTDGLVAEGYLAGLQAREAQGSTFLGQGSRQLKALLVNGPFSCGKLFVNQCHYVHRASLAHFVHRLLPPWGRCCHRPRFSNNYHGCPWYTLS